MRPCHVYLLLRTIINGAPGHAELCSALDAGCYGHADSCLLGGTSTWAGAALRGECAWRESPCDTVFVKSLPRTWQVAGS